MSSEAVVYIYDRDVLIDLGIAISDGVYQSATYDIVLHPDYQGKGIGKRIMTTLMGQLNTESIVRFSVPGKEGFYAKLGFKMMTTGMAIFSPAMSDPDKGYLINS